ncbi:WD40-repeat-containing domain protein [Suillus clintonianus]|uniref:WD40-repeat-containing domain protein n=1 Tax=Suillus clintonianus TaxID=1904413 RepID=UPI001B87DD7C|nr:WD40-repeat-containing domain protein [Suillus clintonianus]KAG2122221.1 WD40-repeat-containing domain protein [Suillus clintonianus]
MKKTSMPPPASATSMILTPVMTLKCHEQSVSSISYFPDGKQMISGSRDKTARRWDMQKGKEIAEARDVCEEGIYAVAVSRDGRYVSIGGGELDNGELKACEVETGIVKTFQGHSQRVTCIDISSDSTLLASGSWDATARIWSLKTGELVAGPFRSVDWVGVVRFSPDLKKLAVKSEARNCLEVWDVHAETLDVRAGKSGGNPSMTFAPVFWTNENNTIIAACDFTNDEATTIHEFDAFTLETVGAAFEGHTKCVTDLALSSDGALVASISQDHDIKLWAFETRQLLASFHVQNVALLVPSPDLRHLAYTTAGREIYICNTPPSVLAALEAQSTISKPNKNLERLLQSDATRRPTAVRHNLGTSPATSFTPRRQRPPPTVDRQQPIYLRLRNLLHFTSGTNAVPPDRSNQPRGPLDFPATSPLPPNRSASLQAGTQFDQFEISSPPNPSNGVTHFLRQHLSFLIPRHSHGPPVVEVAAGRKFTRLVAANLPEYRKVDDTRHPSSQQSGVLQDVESSDNDSLPDTEDASSMAIGAR